MLDMIQGKLSFLIDGELYGMVIEKEDLTKGKLVAAVALKENAGVALNMQLVKSTKKLIPKK